ncbi:MAG: lamin tail domain-containing protein [Myxococcota bacterium]
MWLRIVIVSVPVLLWVGCDGRPVDLSNNRYHCAQQSDCVSPARCIEGVCTTMEPSHDAGTDAGLTDGGADASFSPDAGGDDAGADASIDAGADAGEPMDAGRAMVDEQLRALRAACDVNDAGEGLVVEGVTVTAVKPLVPDAGPEDGPGFFVQGTPGGAAIFVAIDAEAIDGGPVAVGDQLSFTATGVTRVNSVRQVTSVAALTRQSVGSPISGFIASVDGFDFTQAGVLDSFESRLVEVNAQLTGEPAALGAGYVALPFNTVGTVDAGATLRLRLPSALSAMQGLGAGCSVTASGVPMWRLGGVALPSTWAASSLMSPACPPPRVLGASATSPSRVSVTFSRELDPASVTAGAFSIVDNSAGALAVTAATPSSPRSVLLTTGPQTPSAAYTLTVASSVVDTRQTPVPAGSNTAMFAGAACTPSVVISQIYGRGGTSATTPNSDYVELHNRTSAPAAIGGWSLQYASATNTSSWGVAVTFPAGTVIPAGGYFLIRLVSTGTGTALPTPDALASTDLSQSQGKVLLANTSAAVLSDGTGCPSAAALPSVVDLVGYGTNANCREGMSAANNAPAHMVNTDAIFRRDAMGSAAACADNNDNLADFEVAPLNPRNSMSAGNGCNCQ